MPLPGDIVETREIWIDSERIGRILVECERAPGGAVVVVELVEWDGLGLPWDPEVDDLTDLDREAISDAWDLH
jgi:hypothetical protein